MSNIDIMLFWEDIIDLANLTLQSKKSEVQKVKLFCNQLKSVGKTSRKALQAKLA